MPPEKGQEGMRFRIKKKWVLPIVVYANTIVTLVASLATNSPALYFVHLLLIVHSIRVTFVALDDDSE